MQRQAVIPLGSLCVLLLLALSFAHNASAAYYWQDSRVPTPGKWPSAYDTCRLGEAQRYLDEHNLSSTTYRYNFLTATEVVPGESMCQYSIQKISFGIWLPYLSAVVTNYRSGDPDLCFNGLTLDADGRCAPKNDGPPSCPSNGSNPINGATANKYQLEQDIVSAGPFPLRFERHYNSLALTPGSLASNWRNTYDRALSISADGLSVNAFRANGRAYNFTMSGTTGIAPADIADQLVLLANGNWTLTTVDDEVETYDSRGRLIAIANLAGLTQSLAYDITNRLSTVTDPFGRKFTFGYDANNRIATLTDPSGGVVSYGYDANSNLTSVTYPDGDTNAANNPVRSYLYNESANTSGANLLHALTGILDENGNRFATYKYDSTGRAVSSEHAGGSEKTTLVYNANATTTITDAAGALGSGTARTYNYQNVQGVLKATGVAGGACNACGGTSTTFSYDTNGNVASRTDFNGNLSCFAYDTARHLETVRIEGLAPGSTCPANLVTYTPTANSSERKIVTAWHATFRLPIQIDETGRRTTYAYFANSTLQTQTVTDTVLNKSRSWNYTYDTNGQLKTVNGPRLAVDVADVTTYDYYATAGASNAIGDLWKITDALGHITTFSQYDKHGRPLSSTDPNGLVVGLSYDALGRLKTRTQGGNTTVFDYDPSGLLKKLTLPDLSNYSYVYDAAHRLTSITDNLSNKVEYTPDLLGNITRQVIKNPDGTVAKTQSSVFDALNRLQQSLGATNQTTQFSYDANGNLKTTIDPKNHPASTYVYDALNRLTQVQDAAAGITQYRYDALDQLTQVTAPNGTQTSYTVDALGNRLSEASPDRGTLQATYDEAGNRKTRTDARSITASYSYDALNRLTAVSYPSAGENITYSYDTGAGCTNGIGRLCQVQDGAGITTFAYDSRGNLTQQLRSEAGLSFTTGIGYDSVNRISQLTTPGGRTVSFGRNAIGRINSITATINGIATAIVSQITTNALGLITQQTFANGYIENHGYNSDGQVLSASQINPNGGGGTGTGGGTSGGSSKQVPIPAWALALMALGIALISARYRRHHAKHLAVLLVFGVSLALSGVLYSAAAYAPIVLHYDANGNIDQRIDGSGTTTYNYDALDRLAGENGPLKIQNLGYDANGNRTGDGAGSYNYLTHSNLLQSAHGQIITPDLAGNIIGDGLYSYVYNQAGQLAQIKQGANTVASYSYDYQGRRTRKLVGSTTTLYHYDQADHLITETNNLGTVLKSYIWRDNTPVAIIDSSSGQDKLYTLEVDSLDTPRTARNETGTIIWQWHSDAFGTSAPNEDPDGDGITTKINLRFPGQYYDAESGLHYNMARYYDPKSGRYLQPDPIGLAGGMNSFAYVNGNPVNFIDPLGLAGETPKKPPGIPTIPPPERPKAPPPRGPGTGCRAIFEACMAGAQKCGPLKKVAAAGCFALWLACEAGSAANN